MSFNFYSEIRGSLVKQDHKNINPETLKKLYQLFIREKFFFEKYRETEIGINHPSYTERSLFTTLNGYTSTELFMNRLSPLEKKNILLLTTLITDGIRRKIKYHDFDTLMAIGSSTYSDTYRSELQSAINDINYKVLMPGQKEVYENMNSSREYITKEQIQETINKKGNDIDLVLTGFSGGKIASDYKSHYERTIWDNIIKRHHRDYINQILEQFIYQEISQKEFLNLVDIDDITGFESLYKELQEKNEQGAEEFLGELLKQHKITLSEKGIKALPPITDEVIKHFFTSTETIELKKEYVRNNYLHELIPYFLKSNNIPFTIESQRENGSDYHIDHRQKTIRKTKNLNPNHRKDGCLIIQFPDCRPIHLNVDTSTIQELYHHEQKYNKSFVLLSHNNIERKKFLTTEREKKYDIPENLTLEEQIDYVRKNKPKIDWEKIIEKRKKQATTTEDKNELPF